MGQSSCMPGGACGCRWVSLAVCQEGRGVVGGSV